MDLYNLSGKEENIIFIIATVLMIIVSALGAWGRSQNLLDGSPFYKELEKNNNKQDIPVEVNNRR